LANSYANGQYNVHLGNAMISGSRIRESSSGALVGKNIAGINSIGKSSSNILNDDKINLNKINMLTSEQKQKQFVTHDNNNITSSVVRNNLGIHRITS
jgi:hypothetical protein